MSESKSNNRYFKRVLGEKVYLSPISVEDAEIFVRWLNDPEIGLPLGADTSPMTLEREKEILSKFASSGYNFAIVSVENDELLGSASIRPKQECDRSADIGIMIGDTANHGKGYGTETVQLLLAYGFKMMNLHSISLSAFAFNEKAIHLYKKVGFKEVGRWREALFVNGRYWDIIMMDILENEFQYPFFDESVNNILQDLKAK